MWGGGEIIRLHKVKRKIWGRGFSWLPLNFSTKKRKLIFCCMRWGNFFTGTISPRRVLVHFPEIVRNLPRTYKKPHYNGEPYRFCEILQYRHTDPVSIFLRLLFCWKSCWPIYIYSKNPFVRHSIDAVMNNIIIL